MTDTSRLPKATVTAAATLAAAGVLAAGGALATGSSTAYDPPVDIELTFVDHIDADMPEQDVFIERAGQSGVWRATPGDRDLSAPVFASAEPQRHDPFDPTANGPYPTGEALGFTLGEWLGAEGHGTYACADGEGQVDITFTGLVPDGVYTMWNFYMASPPTDPFIGTYDIPFGSRDGAESVFHADSDGEARFTRAITPCLQMSGEHLMAGLAIAWHSDGQVYGVDPGAFGYNSHVHLFLGLPPRAGL